MSGGNIAYGCGAGVHSRCIVFALGDARKVAQALNLVISSTQLFQNPLNKKSLFKVKLFKVCFLI